MDKNETYCGNCGKDLTEQESTDFTECTTCQIKDWKDILIGGIDEKGICVYIMLPGLKK